MFDWVLDTLLPRIAKFQLILPETLQLTIYKSPKPSVSLIYYVLPFWIASGYFYLRLAVCKFIWFSGWNVFNCQFGKQLLKVHYIKPFHDNGLFLYPVKTSENSWFFWCFHGVKKKTSDMNGLKQIDINR